MQLTNRYPSLKDKVVFITGGASGIGENLVEAFCRQGAKVAFVDILDHEGEELVARLAEEADCTTPVYYPCDLVDVPRLQQVIAQVGRELGDIGVLINNAATDNRHKFTEVTVEYWNNRIFSNLRPSFFAIQACFPQMQRLGGGSIINFGSVSWYECQGGMTGYTTSKAGLEGMTRGLARDLGEQGIRINTLVPGWVMTKKQLARWVDQETKQEIHRSQCLKSDLKPENISAMVLFLASDDSNMCTAQKFIVDAGWIF